MEYYQSEKINDKLTLIRSLSGELLYLVEGDSKAALIDCCAGVGHLRRYIGTLTDKPIQLLLTHGHVDHAMAAPEFEEVYMNFKDIPLYQSQCSLEERKGYLAAALGELAGKFGEDFFVLPEKEYPFQELTDGMVFDLGGIHVEVYEFPGHTKGSMIFLIREMRILILGDACNNSTFLFGKEANSLEEYVQALTKNRDRLKGKYDRVFLSHHDMETGVEIMDNVLDVCREAMSGQADDIPFEFMGIQAYIAKKCNEKFQRVDGKCGNIVYRKEKDYVEL